MRPSRSGALLDLVRGLRWPARRPVAVATPGAHPSRTRGSSDEFTEYRLYRQGDDPRRLDWKLLARSDRAYVRLATDRAALPTTIVVDASRSMAFPEPAHDKWRTACELALALAAVAHGQGDPVGVTIAGGARPVVVRHRTRRDVVAEIDRALASAAPTGGDALAEAVRAVRTPRVAIVTDLLGDADATLAAARLALAAGGEAFVAHVVAREELAPWHDARVVRDPERPEVERVLAPETRAGYEAAFAAWRASVADAWRAAGAVYTLVPTDEPPAHAVRRIVAPVGAGRGAR